VTSGFGLFIDGKNLTKIAVPPGLRVRLAGMENEEIVGLLREIRDLQKVQIANNQEAVKSQIERMRIGQKRIVIFFALFLIAIGLLTYLPALFGH
jgi:cell division protein FtsX